MKNARFWLVNKGSFHFGSLDEMTAHVTEHKLSLDTLMVIVGEVREAKMQLTLVAAEAPAPRAPRVAKEPKLPAEATLSSVRVLMSDGKGRSKVKIREAVALPVDVVDGCVDWLAHRGDMTRIGKTYTLKQGGAT